MSIRPSTGTSIRSAESEPQGREAAADTQERDPRGVADQLPVVRGEGHVADRLELLHAAAVDRARVAVLVGLVADLPAEGRHVEVHADQVVLLRIAVVVELDAVAGVGVDLVVGDWTPWKVTWWAESGCRSIRRRGARPRRRRPASGTPRRSSRSVLAHPSCAGRCGTAPGSCRNRRPRSRAATRPGSRTRHARWTGRTGCPARCRRSAGRPRRCRRSRTDVGVGRRRWSRR